MGQAHLGWRSVLGGIATCLSVVGCGGGGETAVEAAQAASGGGTVTQLSKASATAAGQSEGAQFASKSFSDALLGAVNAARAAGRYCGSTWYPAAGPLTWNTLAESAALTQVQYLQSNNLFSHTGAQGSSVGDRLTATGYPWSIVGENLAAGFSDVPGAVQGWLDSAGHCANLMNGQFVEMGVALVPGVASNTYQNYWGMVLAAHW